MARIKSLPASTRKSVFVTSSKDNPRGAENLDALAAPSAYPAAVAQEPANVPSVELKPRKVRTQLEFVSIGVDEEGW